MKYLIAGLFALLLGCCPRGIAPRTASLDVYRNSAYVVLNMFDTVVASTAGSVLDVCRSVAGDIAGLGISGPGVHEVTYRCADLTIAFKGTHKARVDLQTALQGEDEAKIKLRTTQYKQSITLLDAMIINAEEILRRAIAAITSASQTPEEQPEDSTDQQVE